MSVSPPDLAEMMRAGERIAMLTAYDSSMAEIMDNEGVDVILVGDSIGNTRLGYRNTLPVTLEESLMATSAVSRAVSDALVVGDMPFLSVGASMEDSVRNAGRYLKEAGASGVKLETPVGGEFSLRVADRLVELGVPVMGHLGLTPQQVEKIGGYRVEGRDMESAEFILNAARKLEDIGVFSLVLEAVPEDLARQVTEEISIPTIGIGAGRYVDGQVLVVDDMLGLPESTPSFVKEYRDLRGEVGGAVSSYIDEVKSGEFPGEENVFDAVEE